MIDFLFLSHFISSDEMEMTSQFEIGENREKRLGYCPIHRTPFTRRKGE
jgi:hypothetical protein